MSTRLRRTAVVTAASAAALVLAACGGGSGFDDGNDASTSPDAAATDTATEEGNGGEDGSGAGELEVLIATSGEAETRAVTDAVAAWSETSGVSAVVRVATDMNQELAQGFAAGSPPDVFYVNTEQFPGYASSGSIKPYFEELSNAGDFHQSLVDNFTYEGTPYCAPKDFSTLALVINDDLWSEAGLTADDYPTTWEELTAVATTLAETNETGLAFGPEWQRVGTFMAQAGGGLVADGAAIVDAAANVDALAYVKELLASGVAAYPADLGTGWGGEAFGTGAAPMAIEGNWIVGALRNDFPDVSYTVVELPAGSAGRGTLQFTNCWGIASDSPSSDDAVSLVEFLTADEQQMAFAEAFGVMPSVSTVTEEWTALFPEQAAFIAGADYAQGVPPIEGVGDVISDFNSQLETLASGDPATILGSVQQNLTAIMP